MLKSTAVLNCLQRTQEHFWVTATELNTHMKNRCGGGQVGVGSGGGTEDGRVETQQQKPFRWRSQTSTGAREPERKSAERLE